MTLHIPTLNKNSDSTTVEAFNQFGNRKESGCIQFVVKLTDYRHYLRAFYNLTLIGKIRVNVNYVNSSEFVTLLIDYSNKRDFDTIFNYRIEEKTMQKVKLSPIGGTFQVTDGIIRDVSRESGYSVGLNGTTIKPDELTVDFLIEFATDNNSEFIGYWLHDGVIYVDTIAIVDDLANALFLAVDNRQLSIYDFSTDSCFDVGSNQVDEKSYFANIARRYRIGSRDIVVISELVDQYGKESFVCGCDLSNPESLRQFNVKYNPQPIIDRGIVQFVNSAQSQSRRENNVNGCDK